MFDRVSEIFAECQRHSAVHKSSVKKLSTLLKETSAREQDEIIELIHRGVVDQYLLVAKKEAAIERLVKFYCDFLAASVANFHDEKVFRAGISHLLKRSAATDKNVRYRACQSLAFVLTSIYATETEVSDDIWQSIIAVVVPRLNDKAPNVRMWAVKTLANLQNPLDTSDPVVLGLIRLMNTDTASAVRVSAIDHVAVVKLSLTSLVSRVQDIKPEVRIAALERLAGNVAVGQLSSAQRATIVIFGLADRDPGCKSVAIGLIQKWATSVENNIPKLLQLINLKTNPQAVELVANTLIDIVENANANGTTNPFPASAGLKAAVRDARPQWEAKDISRIPGSEILWAQLRCDYARKNFPPSVAESVIEHLIPDTVELCSLLASAHALPDQLGKKLSLQLSAKNLLSMTSFMDAADVSGGLELTRVCEQMLVDVRFPDMLIEAVLDAWLRGLGKADNTTIFNNITALSEKFGSIDETEGAEELDSGALEVLAATRGLQLVNWALGLGIADAQNNQRLSTTFYQFAIESLQSTSPAMRRLAVRCIGLMGLSSETMCTNNREILFQVAAQDLEEVDVREQALQALVDIATVHPSLFSDHPVLTGLLLRVQEDVRGEFTTTSMRRVATEAAAKLLFTGTLSEPQLFSNVLKVFFVPEVFDFESSEADDSEENANAHIAVTRLQQLLSVFLQSYSMVVSAKYQQIIVDSIEHVVADLTVLCRDEIASVTVLPKLANHLLTMCENQQAIDKTSSSYASSCARLAASLSREALKLGNSKLEKATIKELIKVLVSLSPKTWVTADTAASMYKVTKCIARNCTLDKALKKSLDLFSCSCAKEAIAFSALASQVETVEEENMDDSVAYAVYELEEQKKLKENLFYSYAPGIADLVELIAEDEDSDVEAGAMATATAAVNDCEADDSDIEEKDEDEEDPTPAEAPAPKPSKSASKAKKVTALQEDTEALPPPVPVADPAKSIVEKPSRKKAVAKPTTAAKTTTGLTEAKPAKSTGAAAAASTPTKPKISRAKSTTKTIEDDDEPAATVSRSRRARTAKVYTEDDGGDLDGENINPQAV